jgi:hypothetical protein
LNNVLLHKSGGGEAEEKKILIRISVWGSKIMKSVQPSSAKNPDSIAGR